MPGPLDGVRVLDFGQYIAGPGAGQALADLGAEVIKVEGLRGDQARGIGAFGQAMVQAYNRDKASLAIDVAHPDGQRIVFELLADADVLIHNFRPGSAERLGLGYDQLRERYPRLVYASVSGFGTRGPSRERPGLDIAAQAEFGVMHLTGAADGPPQRVGYAVADVAAANALTTGILAALFARHATGRGTHVQTSLMEAILSQQAAVWGEFMLTATPPRRRGNGQAHAAPAADVLELADGPIVLSAYTQDRWAALCRLARRPDMIEDPRFADNPARVRHRPQMLAALREAFADSTRAQVIERLTAAGIVCGAVRSFADVATDEDVAAARILVDVTAPDGAEFTVPGVPFTLDGVRRTASRAAPDVGAHTPAVLSGLGYGPAAITDLIDRGVVAPAATR